MLNKTYLLRAPVHPKYFCLRAHQAEEPLAMKNALSNLTYLRIIRFWKHSKDITIKWSIIFVERRLSPATRMEAPLSPSSS